MLSLRIETVLHTEALYGKQAYSRNDAKKRMEILHPSFSFC